MKIFKIMLAAAMLAVPAVSFAQEADEEGGLQQEEQYEVKKPSRNKKTIDLPKAGDFGVGIDVVPVFRYVGNLFNGTQNNTLDSFGGSPTLGADFIGNVVNPNVSIMGRYMITDHLVGRLNVGVIADVVQNSFYVTDDAAQAIDPMSEAQVVDTQTMTKAGASVALGLSYRMGKNRVQGYFGGDLVYGVASYNNTYSYGNAITELNQSPTRHDFGETPATTPSQWSDAFILSSQSVNNSTIHCFGLGLHVGMEIFLTSYMSLGGEISFTFLGSYTPQQYQTLEGYNTYNNTVETWNELVSPETYSFHCGTENLGGKLYMMFYF